KNNGMTLIELIIVLLVISIISAISFPGVSTWLSDNKLKAATRNIQSLIQKTRLQAIRERTEITIDFNTNENSYFTYIDRDKNGTYSESSDTIIENKRVIEDVNLYEVSFGGGFGSRNVFDSRGFCKATGHAYLKNQNNKFLGVVIRSSYGNSRIKKSLDGGNTYK
ncbi:MAG: prepilin-type N-terminal cleavage/methylation domain-containing protein, partial [bacterium]|nr:prepilin-type N-terminal cleavage/methylation domain-containing protein [bacterium]